MVLKPENMEVRVVRQYLVFNHPYSFLKIKNKKGFQLIETPNIITLFYFY